MNSSTQLPLQAYKEKEIEVWKMYTDALREIVKEKDPIWKVTQIRCSLHSEASAEKSLLDRCFCSAARRPKAFNV